MVGTPVAGALYDSSKSYDIPFYLAGGFLVIASLISSAIHLIQYRQSKRDKSTQGQEEKIFSH